jgi:DNA modification methylase
LSLLNLEQTMITKEFREKNDRKKAIEERWARRIEFASPTSLKHNPNNARTHSQKQITQIAASIRKLGFNNPVLVDADDMILAGHGRTAAAKELGLAQIPIIRLIHLTPEEAKAYILADNRLAELAGWDNSVLAAELEELSALDLDFDIELTGFSIPEIDQVIETAGEDGVAACELDDLPDIPERAVTRPGDIWTVGQHRLICGDATRKESFEALLAGETAGLIFVDFPYNVPIDGHVSGLGRNKHREFAMASGEMTEEEFTQFLMQSLDLHAKYSREGALHYVCMDWRHAGELLAAGNAIYDAQLNLCVWVKSNGGMGSLYRSQHELVFVFKKGKAPHVNNVQLGKYGRYRTNVWKYAGANSFGKTRDEDLAAHPTVKPVQMVADAILDASMPGDVVLDGFAGSGTTLIAAHKVRRRGYGIELDPIYCDVILKRLSAATREEAIHQESGRTFSQMEAERIAASNGEAGDE